MPRSSEPEGYPAIFYDMIRDAAASTAALRFDCGTEADAKRLRFQLYEFKKALKKSPHESDRQLAAQATSILHQVRGSFLILQPRDHTIEVLSLTEQLIAQGGHSGGFSPPSGGDNRVVESDHMPRTDIPITPRVEPEHSAQEELIERYMKED